jgi:hypothetical protein
MAGFWDDAIAKAIGLNIKVEKSLPDRILEVCAAVAGTAGAVSDPAMRHPALTLARAQRQVPSYSAALGAAALAFPMRP